VQAAAQLSLLALKLPQARLHARGEAQLDGCQLRASAREDALGIAHQQAAVEAGDLLAPLRGLARVAGGEPAVEIVQFLTMLAQQRQRAPQPLLEAVVHAAVIT